MSTNNAALNQSPLSKLIEKIDESKEINATDQNEINKIALKGGLSASEIMAINKLTQAIENGEIKVQ